MRHPFTIALVLSLTACSSRYDPDRCSAGGPQVQHLSDNAQSCVGKWSRALSTSPDPARDVADAVLMACNDTIPNDADDTTADSNVSDGSSKAVWAEARHLAMFRIVEERAGHCSEKK